MKNSIPHNYQVKKRVLRFQFSASTLQFPNEYKDYLANNPEHGHYHLQHVSTAPPTPLYNTKLFINLSQGDLEQRKRWKIHGGEGEWHLQDTHPVMWQSLDLALCSIHTLRVLSTVFELKTSSSQKSQNCFSMQSHAVSLVTMVIHSRAKHFHFTTFVMLQGLKD